jgi:DNA end-binding protein Ku
MAPRSIWNGAIAFGAVTVPVKVYGAVEDKGIHFHEVHLEDEAPIMHKLVDPTTGDEVDRKDVVKGYEVEQGEWVEVEDDEIKAADQAKRKAIELDEFVCAPDIDPVYYEKTYNLAPQDGAEDGYALLAAAMQEAGRVGLGHVSLRSKEQLVALKATDNLIRMHVLHPHDEIVRGKDVDIPKPSKKPTKKEVEMAAALVDTLAADFEPSRYEDTYRDRVMKLIKAKAQGKEPKLPEAKPVEAPDDLLAALQASVDAVSKKGRKG